MDFVNCSVCSLYLPSDVLDTHMKNHFILKCLCCSKVVTSNYEQHFADVLSDLMSLQMRASLSGGKTDSDNVCVDIARKVFKLRRVLRFMRRKIRSVKCGHCSRQVLSPVFKAHQDAHWRETMKIHADFNWTVADYGQKSSLTEKLCSLSLGALCPPDPLGPCAIDALKKLIKVYNCSFLEFFGERYQSGWFNSLDLHRFLADRGYRLVVEQENRIIRLDDREMPASKTIIMGLTGKLHWDSARFQCISFRVCSLVLKVLLKFKLLIAKFRAASAGGSVVADVEENINCIKTIIFPNLIDELKFKIRNSKHPFRVSRKKDETGLISLARLLKSEGIKTNEAELLTHCSKLSIDMSSISPNDLTNILNQFDIDYQLFILLRIESNVYTCLTCQTSKLHPIYILNERGDGWSPLMRCCVTSSGHRLPFFTLHNETQFKCAQLLSPISNDLLDRSSVKDKIIKMIKDKGPESVMCFLRGKNNLNLQDSILVDSFMARSHPAAYSDFRKRSNRSVSSIAEKRGLIASLPGPHKVVQKKLMLNQNISKIGINLDFMKKYVENLQSRAQPIGKLAAAEKPKPLRASTDLWMKRLAEAFKEESREFDEYNGKDFEGKKDENQEEDDELEGDKDEASGKDESEGKEDESDEESENSMEFIEDDKTLECCWTFNNLNVSNSFCYSEVLSQYLGRHPDLGCLSLQLDNITEIFKMIHESGVYTLSTSRMLKDCVKFRHDCFCYLILSELSSEAVAFGSDMDLKFLGSDRTPDYVKRDGNNITIYEFSVVNNILRGNLMKGIDKETSKYKREIIAAEELGFEVEYRPILLSTSSSLKDNIDYLRSKNIIIRDANQPFIQIVIDCIPAEYRYLIQLTFMQENEIIALSEGRSEKGWQYEYKNINLERLLSFKTGCTNLTDEFNYNIYFTEQSRFVSNDNGKYTGKFLKNLANDDLATYKEFEKEMKGKKLFPLKGYRQLGDAILKLRHHRKIDCTEAPEELINNFLKFDYLPYTKFNLLSNKLYDLPLGSLVQEFNQEKIFVALSRYERRLNNWKIPRNSAPVVISSPRRSFYNLLDSSKVTDCHYSNGIKINYKGSTPSVHMVLSKLSGVDFTKRVIYSEKPNDYKVELDKLYDWLSVRIPKPHTRNFKANRALLQPIDKPIFDELKASVVKLQTDYIKSIKGSNGGVLKNDDLLSQQITSECSWAGGGLYKLYMDETPDLNELYAVMHQTTLKMNFKLQMPQSDDIGFLKNLKELEHQNLSKHLDEIICTNLMQIMIFHSRLCYTLAALSNRNESNRYLILDNLGLTNVLLIVKGGKKLLNTRKSKIFKLVSPALRDLQEYNPNNHHNGEFVMNETAWMQINQTELLDGMALPYKYLCNYTSLRSKYDERVVKETLFIPAILSLHNRKKTEINLHNMRYFMVNCMGDFSQVQDLLDDLDTPCYTKLESGIYYGFVKYFKRYVNDIVPWTEQGNNSDESFISRKVNHPFLNRNLNNVDDFAYCIYSTYLMSKSNENQTLEQTLNLKSVMETHDYYQKNKPVVSDELSTLYASDFNYSDTSSYEVGKVLSAEIKKNFGIRSLQVKYDQLMNQNVDQIANNRGLRHEGQTFFGHKGYFVVYTELLKQNKLKDVLDIINSNISLNDKYQRIKRINNTFRLEQQTNKLDQVIFHIVDKVQRGGPREIYVMDYKTKLHQHTVEKMFKFVCELVDNEMITIPAAKRASVIHKKNFEYRSERYVKYYLTLDCRKWAPRSNFGKYLTMLEGMKEVLPYEFIKDVKGFFSVYSRKQIHTRVQIRDQLLKMCPQYSKYFEADEDNNSAFFEMPYSFVMGIFNMLSSLYHAGVQLLAEREVALHIYREFKVVAILLLDAHSDDSQGVLNIRKSKESKIICKKSMSYYQHLQKTCNHLMSIKKCNISLTYLEFLSILYLNSELLPLLPKFLGNFSANFSGKGISQDFRSVISKSIELQMNGESHTNCYRIQIILSNFYRNFYRVRCDTSLPCLGGFVSSWPPLYVYFGSSIDEVRLSYTDPRLFNKIMSYASQHMEFDPVEGTFSLKHMSNSRVPRAYREFKSKLDLPSFPDAQWFFSQNKTRSSHLNLLWFRAMLDDRNFMISLLNINEIRRMVDSFYYASRDTIICSTQTFNINSIYLSILKTEPQDVSYYKIYTKYFKNAIEFYEDLSLIEHFTLEDKAVLTYKPTTLSLNDMNDIPTPKGKSLSIAVSICRKELQPYLFEDLLYDAELERFKEHLNLNEIPTDMKTIKNYLDFVNKRREKVFFMYMRSPSNSRTLVGAEGMLNHLVNNYHNSKKLSINTNAFRMLIKKESKLDRKIVNYVNTCYLYHVARLTRDNDLMMIKLNSSMGGIILNNVFSNKPDVDNLYVNFTDFIGRFSGTSINLKNMEGFAFWIDKQYKVMGEWVGKGTLYVKLKYFVIIFYTNNDIIEHCITDAGNEMLFQDSEMVFLSSLFKNSNLRFEFYPRSLQGNYFGYNKQGSLGIHKNDFIRVGVPCYINQTIDDKFNPEYTQIHYEYGKYIITNFGERRHLITFDYLSYQCNKGTLLEVLDWESLSIYQKNLFMDILTSGTFGSFEELSYISEDLINNFIKTDLYKTFYKSVVKGKADFLKIVWADLVSSSTSSDELLPILYENTSMADLSKLLPESKKENLRLLQFFNVDSKLLFDFSKTLSGLDNDAQRSDYMIKVLSDLGENYGLVTLPEVGDPMFFSNFTNAKASLSTLCSYSYDLSCALDDGFNSLNFIEKQKATKGLKRDPNTIFFYSTFIELLSYHDFPIIDFSALTQDTICVHKILEAIFEDKNSLVKFSKALRKTSLARAPRHPRFLANWQSLLANLYKKFAVTDLRQDEVDLMNPMAKKIFNKSCRTSQNINDHELILAPITSLYYQVDYEIEMDRYEKDLNCFANFYCNSHYAVISAMAVDDWADENDESFDKIRQTSKRSYEFVETIAPRELSGSVATRYFIPLRGVHTKYIKSIKYYLYNVNEDIAKNEGWIPDRCINENRSMHRYQEYYKMNLSIPFQELVETKKIPDYEKPTSHYIAAYNLHDPNIYNEDLLKNLIDKEKVDKIQHETLKETILSNKSPIIKAMTIARLLNSKNQKIKYEELIREALKTFQKDLSNIDESVEKLLIMDFRYAGKDKRDLIMKSTGYRKEFMQLDTILDKDFSDILLKSTKLDKLRKITIINHINAVLKYYRAVKDKNKMAFFGFLKILVKEVEEETKCTTEGLKLEETLRMLINNNSKDVLEDDDSDLFSEPEETIKTWVIKR